METGRITRPKGKRWEGAKYVPKRKPCFFCVNKAEVIDYKEPAKLRNYMSDAAKIASRRRSGACAKHQRVLATAIKRARYLALLPYTAAHISSVGIVSTQIS